LFSKLNYIARFPILLIFLFCIALLILHADLSQLKLSLSCEKEVSQETSMLPKDDIEHLETEACVKTTFELLIFQSPVDSNKPWMDYWPDREYCCLPEMVDSGRFLLSYS
jgi:hypothetical protein